YSATGQSLYTVLPIGKTTEDDTSDFFSGGKLQTRDLFGPITATDGGNKLWNRTLFKFHAPSRGCYSIQATSLQTGFLTVELNLRDVSANSTFQTKLIKFLEDGDYAVRVSGESAVRFGMRVDLLPRTEADCH